MKLSTHLVKVVLCLAVAVSLAPTIVAQTASSPAKDLNIALQRGYRTGYSDGYMAGYRDTIDQLARDVNRHPDYSKADRAFTKEYGMLEDYRDGYQQGFENGYATGFEKRSFESTLPPEIKRRGVVSIGLPAGNNVALSNGNDSTSIPQQSSADMSTASAPTYTGDPNAVIIIPRDTELMLELQNDLSTSRNREGDKFTAKITSPSEIAGAIVEGRVAKVVQPGRLKRRSQLLLTFDRIVVSDSRWSNFSATLTEVMPVKGDNIKVVDNEGTAIGRSSLKTDALKVGGATGAGLIAGAVIAGPVGAGVGAAMGAAFGVGAVVIERGKHVNMNKNQQIRIKTSYETQIR